MSYVILRKIQNINGMGLVILFVCLGKMLYFITCSNHAVQMCDCTGIL